MNAPIVKSERSFREPDGCVASRRSGGQHAFVPPHFEDCTQLAITGSIFLTHGRGRRAAASPQRDGRELVSHRVPRSELPAILLAPALHGAIPEERTGVLGAERELDGLPKAPAPALRLPSRSRRSCSTPQAFLPPAGNVDISVAGIS